MVTESLISTEVPDEQLPIRVEAAPAHLREDAERNRKRLIEAAASAFAEFGFGVPIEEIARRAGVGKATVFRRFPTKERLVEAIMVERMTMLAEAGAPLLDADDAGAALRQFMRTGVELISQDRGLCDAVQGR
jgi:AcrR family transcriptional regulator